MMAKPIWVGQIIFQPEKIYVYPFGDNRIRHTYYLGSHVCMMIHDGCGHTRWFFCRSLRSKVENWRLKCIGKNPNVHKPDWSCPSNAMVFFFFLLAFDLNDKRIHVRVLRHRWISVFLTESSQPSNDAKTTNYNTPFNGVYGIHYTAWHT